MRNIPLPIRNVIKEVCEETGASFSLVEEIFYHQFEFLKDCMESGEKNEYSTFRNILLKHFGTFYASEGKVNNMKKHSLAKQQNGEQHS